MVADVGVAPVTAVEGVGGVVTSTVVDSEGAQRAGLNDWTNKGGVGREAADGAGRFTWL